MYKRRDNSLNLGCANCAHYVGRQPVNVPNFACNAGVEQFKVFFCYNFLGKGIHENERIQSDTQTKIFLKECGLNPKNWRRINESATELIIRHKISGKIKVVRKDESVE